jgi:cyclophilin family peptidyl-prolyl cis-trans isomerase
MIQGGDPQSRNAPREKRLGQGGPGYELDPEIGAPHIKGALAAARTPNPQKRSSGSQFYVVQGVPITDDYLDKLQQQKGFTYNEAQKKLYKEMGGAPFLMVITRYSEKWWKGLKSSIKLPPLKPTIQTARFRMLK